MKSFLIDPSGLNCVNLLSLLFQSSASFLPILKSRWWHLLRTPRRSSQIGRPTHLLLEEGICLSLALLVLLDGLIAHLIVNLDLVLGHLDVLFNDAYFLLLLWSDETEVHLILLLPLLFTHIRYRRLTGSTHYASRPSSSPSINIFAIKLVQFLISLQVDLVLSVELHGETYYVGD